MIKEHKIFLDSLTSEDSDTEHVVSAYRSLQQSTELRLMFKSQHPGLSHNEIDYHANYIFVELPFYTTGKYHSQPSDINFPLFYTIVFAPKQNLPYPNYEVDSEVICFFRNIDAPYDKDDINKHLVEERDQHGLITLTYDGYVLTLDGHLHYVKEDVLAAYDSLSEIIPFHALQAEHSWLGANLLSPDDSLRNIQYPILRLPYLQGPVNGL